MSSFRSILFALCLGTILILAAVWVNARRPHVETLQPGPDFVTASGKCGECHRIETAAVVAQFEMSKHAREGVTCLDCHAMAPGQIFQDHNGFRIAKNVTSANCKSCHPTQYTQYERSRHAAPAWAAVRGLDDFTPEQVAFAEALHPGAVDRPPNALAEKEGQSAFALGCENCHDVGRPNPDGSIGSCTDCHARHSASVKLAREPQTCGQCHLGPDHSQLEIYSESKHGALFNSQRDQMNLSADPKTLTVKDMSVPTCATCHMSGIEGQKFTHDVGERLSWFLFAAVSEKRQNYDRSQQEMKEVCGKCHASVNVDSFYEQAENVVAAVNEKVSEAAKLMDHLRAEGLLTPEPFDEPIEFVYFDYWHYYGRTAKHGAFMGGADFVQWHGNYELLAKMTELRDMAKNLRDKKGLAE